PDRLADLAEREHADLVLLGGDLLDSDHAYYETTRTLSRALGRIGVPVFISPGNHDFYAPRSPYAATLWQENVHIFTRETMEAVDLPELGCVVHGAAFTSPACDTSPIEGFHVPEDGKTHLMVLHGDVEGKGRYGSIALRDIADSGLAYLALGHVHAASGAQTAGRTTWAYPGCPEGRGFDELGEKGALVVTLDGAAVSVKFVPLCKRRYEMMTVDITGGHPAQRLEAALPKNARMDSYRIFLTGESGEEGVDTAALEGLAAPYFYSVSVRDMTRVRQDLWSRGGEDTLTGLFLRTLRGKLDAASTDGERAVIEKAVRFGLAALENREDCCR
ncbi:MAG: metallophosphoesterase, partial [Pseudoflavonifractor sp.]